MPDTITRSQSDILTENARLEAALAESTRDALLEHARMGRSVPVSRNGQIVWLTPDDIFARYGVIPPPAPHG